MMAYDKELPEYGDLMTISQFRQRVADGALINYDGFGYPVRFRKMDGVLDDSPQRRRWHSRRCYACRLVQQITPNRPNGQE